MDSFQKGEPLNGEEGKTIKGKHRNRNSRFEADRLLSIPGGDEDGTRRPDPRIIGPITNPNPSLQHRISPPSRESDTRDEA